VSSARLVVLAYDPDGHKLWEQWNFGGDDTGAGIAVDAVANIYVVGRRRCARGGQMSAALVGRLSLDTLAFLRRRPTTFVADAQAGGGPSRSRK
jgi:hypothetical protein